MAFDLDKADSIRQALGRMDLRDGEHLGEKKMFGGLCFTLSGKMLAGIDISRLMVRLSDEDLERALGQGEATPMDFTGKPLRNFAFIVDAAWESPDQLEDWLKKSAQFVREHMLSKPASKRKKKVS